MDIPKLNDWLENLTEPSGRLYNILASICIDDDISPGEITRERFMSVKGAGIMMWGEFMSLKKGIDHKVLYANKVMKPIYTEIQTGKLWDVEGEIYELYDMRVTMAESPKEFTTCAFFRSTDPNSKNRLFEERIEHILAQPEIYKKHFENSDEPKIPKRLPSRIAYTVGKSNKVKWFDISEMPTEFKASKDGQNHIEFYYPFKACFRRFIAKEIKGINPLSDGQYSTLEETLKIKE